MSKLFNLCFQSDLPSRFCLYSWGEPRFFHRLISLLRKLVRFISWSCSLWYVLIIRLFFQFLPCLFSSLDSCEMVMWSSFRTSLSLYSLQSFFVFCYCLFCVWVCGVSITNFLHFSFVRVFSYPFLFVSVVLIFQGQKLLLLLLLLLLLKEKQLLETILNIFVDKNALLKNNNNQYLKPYGKTLNTLIFHEK